MARPSCIYLILVYITCNKYALGVIELPYSVFQVTAFNPRERLFLYDYHISEDNCEFVNLVTNEAILPIHIAVTDVIANTFEQLLLQYNFQFARLSTRLYESRLTSHNSSKIDQFLVWDDVLRWIADRAAMYSILEKKSIGTTYENREIFYLKLSKRWSRPTKKPVVFIIGGEQGRDWIPSAVILNFISKMLAQKDNLPHLLELYDFYIVPIANPDGYHYSLTRDRFWAKNRRRFYSDYKKCLYGNAYGVNIDRNWMWAKSPSLNNEGNDCNSVYLGPTIFSEAETLALFHLVNSIAAKVMAFIDVRGFARLITVPYAHTHRPNVNLDLMMEILSMVQGRLEMQHNVSYFYGPASSIFYNFTGCAADFVKEKLNVPIVMSVYLKQGDDFLPKSSHIEPLTEQFITILEETLMLAHDIYSPLFNTGWKCHCFGPITSTLLLYVNLFVYLK